MNKHSFTISKIINGGYGLGQLEDGRITMVRYTLPGEQVTVSITQDKKSYLIGKLLTLDQQSEHRTEPPCQHYGACGGCDLQHADYVEQLRCKDTISRNLIDRQVQSDKGDLSSCLKQVYPSPVASGYRQRIRLVVNNGRSFGFRKHQSHEVVEIKKCYIARGEINDVMTFMSGAQAMPHLLSVSEEFELLWDPSSGNVTTVFHLTRKPRPADFKSAKVLTDEIPLLERVFFAGQAFPLTPAASPQNSDKHLGIRYQCDDNSFQPFSLNWEVGGFCQVNLEQNKNLIKIVCDLAAVKGHETVLDLFCGAGNFSLPLAQKAQFLVGIEGQGSAIRSAKANAAFAAINNTEFYKQPIHQACEKRQTLGEAYDCLVIDPPRQGIPGLAKTLFALCKNRMVYISCDPATLCRDLNNLLKVGFSIKTIQPVDMFPQTHHIETVVLLEKN